MQQRLAMGGMGEIHLAHDTLLGRRVVIKYLLDEAAADRERVAMFLHEARAVALCEHPNIIRIFDVGMDRGRYFMALEHLDGWDVAAILGRARESGRPVPLAVALRLVIDAALGLHAAHEAASADGEPLRLVHRDVSLHNLFVTRPGTLKVLDFGVAKTDAQVHSTVAGTLKGTLAYMSPEQCSAIDIDRRSDVFSLGVVAYELVSGERLFKRETSAEIVAAVVTAYVPPPARPIDAELLLVLRRALARDRELRLPTAEAFARALMAHPVASREEVAEYLAVLMPEDTRVDAAPVAPRSATPTPPREATTPTVDLQGARDAMGPRRSKRPMVIAGLSFVAVVAAGTLLLQRASTSPPAAPEIASPVREAPVVPVVAAEVPAAVPVEHARVPDTNRRPAKAAPPKTGEGLLTVESEPWADVYVNGVLVGQTPLVRHTVAAGRLRLRLTNGAEHLAHTQSVDLRPGEDLRLRADLQQRTLRAIH